MSHTDSEKQNCLFCKIIKGSVPSEKVFENNEVFAFKDINPQAPIHVLIVPKEHVKDIMDLSDDNFTIVEDLFRGAQLIAQDLGIDKSGFRTVFNTGHQACQTVHHLHLHLIGGAQLGGSMAG